MSIRLSISTAFALALLAPVVAGAQSTGAEQPAIYGSQIMTQRERQQYRQRMGNASSAEEQSQIRAEHHHRMQERAQQMGQTLPDEPPAGGMGAGKVMGPGQGRGMGGMGQGMSPGGGGRGAGG